MQEKEQRKSSIQHLLHALSDGKHFTEGTHRFDDPVSNTTVKYCPGVPMYITP